MLLEPDPDLTCEVGKDRAISAGSLLADKRRSLTVHWTASSVIASTPSSAKDRHKLAGELRQRYRGGTGGPVGRAGL